MVHKVTVLISTPDNFDDQGVKEAVDEALNADEDIKVIEIVTVEKVGD